MNNGHIRSLLAEKSQGRQNKAPGMNPLAGGNREGIVRRET